MRQSGASASESWNLPLHPVIVGLTGLALFVALAGLAVAVALRRRQLTAWSKVQDASLVPRRPVPPGCSKGEALLSRWR